MTGGKKLVRSLLLMCKPPYFTLCTRFTIYQYSVTSNCLRHPPKSDIYVIINVLYNTICVRNILFLFSTQSGCETTIFNISESRCGENFTRIDTRSHSPLLPSTHVTPASLHIRKSSDSSTSSATPNRKLTLTQASCLLLSV